MPKNKQVCCFVWGHLNMVCDKFDEYLIKCVQKKGNISVEMERTVQKLKTIIRLIVKCLTTEHLVALLSISP